MADGDGTTEQPSTTLLLDLVQTMGRIEGQNQLILQEQARASDSRKEQYQVIDEIRLDARDAKGKLDSIVERVGAMEPDVRNMKAFRAQLAVAVFVVTAVVTGAINLVWLGVTHLTEIKSAVREFLK